MNKSQRTLDLLRQFESRNITYMEREGSWPIVWERARGESVWDAGSRRYLDLTAAFGVAACGHANPEVVRAGREQMGHLLHAMGDVHPHPLKALLTRKLSQVTFERWKSSKVSRHGKTILCNSGFEAVEAALKTALLVAGKPGVLAFEGGYHGLGYGALNATHREHFRRPFQDQLAAFGVFVPFPQADTDQTAARRGGLKALETAIRRMFRRKSIGAVLVEPVQVRGGINIPPPEFLPMLRRICNREGALLVLDEIYTGFGRTGRWFACEHFDVAPDIICLGKALTGGFPLSACVGRADIMDRAWPISSGEAIHTSTFLGHPVGCAMALAQMKQLASRRLVDQSAARGDFLLRELQELALRAREHFGGRFTFQARGLGLLAGLELREEDGAPATDASLAVVREMLRLGFILLPEGEYANIISFTPPLTISERQLKRTVNTLEDVLRRLS